jgi:hypothetical protein
MIPVSQALQDYGSRCAVSTLDIYPLVWSAYYSDRLLGEIGIPVLPETTDALGKVVFGCVVPFGYSTAIQSTFVVIDAYRAASIGLPIEESRRVLYVSRLAQFREAVLTTHWVVPYRLDDFETIYEEPEKSPYMVPKVFAAFDLLAEKRFTNDTDLPFDQAEYLGRNHLEELLA